MYYFSFASCFLIFTTYSLFILFLHIHNVPFSFIQLVSSSGSGAVDEGLSEECMDIIIHSNMEDVMTGNYGQAIFKIVEGMK